MDVFSLRVVKETNTMVVWSLDCQKDLRNGCFSLRTVKKTKVMAVLRQKHWISYILKCDLSLSFGHHCIYHFDLQYFA